MPKTWYWKVVSNVKGTGNINSTLIQITFK